MQGNRAVQASHKTTEPGPAVGQGGWRGGPRAWASGGPRGWGGHRSSCFMRPHPPRRPPAAPGGHPAAAPPHAAPAFSAAQRTASARERPAHAAQVRPRG